MLNKLLFAALAAGASAVAYANDGGAVNSWGPLAAAIAMGLGAFGVASGQGRAASSALEGIARNPAAKADVFTPLILALVFMEFQALLCFVIAYTVK